MKKAITTPYGRKRERERNLSHIQQKNVSDISLPVSPPRIHPSRPGSPQPAGRCRLLRTRSHSRRMKRCASRPTPHTLRRISSWNTTSYRSCIRWGNEGVYWGGSFGLRFFILYKLIVVFCKSSFIMESDYNKSLQIKFY